MAFSLSENDRVDAQQALTIINRQDATLKEAAQYYFNHHLRFSESPKLFKIAEQYIEGRKKRDRRPRTLSDLHQRLTTFCEEFGNLKPSEVTPEEIENWVYDHEEWSNRSKINYLTKISQLFNYAVNKNWADTNIIDSIERPSTDQNRPKIFTVEQIEALLEYSSNYDLTAFVSIGAFAGLRTAELNRLTWENVRSDENSIIVDGKIAKSRSIRTVHIEPCLKSWLEKIPDKSGSVVKPEKLRIRFESLKQMALQGSWVQNGLRHSYASYHLAKFGDEIKTAKEMGHSDPRILHNHYKALVTQKNAEEFWSLKLDSIP